MNYQSNLAFELKILLGDIDLTISFCSFQDKLKPKIKNKWKRSRTKIMIKNFKDYFTCAEPDSILEQCLAISS
jgi:hypothetical protein